MIESALITNWEVFRPEEETVYHKSFFRIVGDQVHVIDVAEFSDKSVAHDFYEKTHRPSVPSHLKVDTANFLNDSFTQIFYDLNDEVWVIRVMTMYNLKKYISFDSWIDELDIAIDEKQKYLMQMAWDASAGAK